MTRLHIRTFLFLLLFLILMALRPGASAQKSTEPAGISPAKIFEGYLAATGGANAHKELTTLKASGTFGVTSLSSIMHPAGAYTFLYKAPAKDIFEMQVISHGTSWVGRRDEHLIRRLAPEEPGFMSIGVGGAGFIKGDSAEAVEQ